MSNYDLEETRLLNWQLILSSAFIFSIIISLGLTYNQLLKHKKQKTIFSSSEEQIILKINRIIAIIISIGFLLINTKDKKVKQAYGTCNEKNANLQIGASVFTLIASAIVLYVAFSSEGGITDVENPEI